MSSGNSTVTTLHLPARPDRVAAGAKVARVADRIREMIIQDELPPGAPIRERALSERLNVSRTPLRETLKILSAEGLVELQPHRGAVVAAPGSQEVHDILQLLGVIEAYAGELACERITEAALCELKAFTTRCWPPIPAATGSATSCATRTSTSGWWRPQATRP